MRILFVVDGRSPIALNWIGYFIEAGYQVHMVSTYPCEPELPLASLHVVPVALSEATGAAGQAGSGSRGFVKRLIPVGLRTSVRQWAGPLTLPKAARHLREIVDRIQPDLVHAMRIPFEGMLVALAEPQVPLLVSIWGNDFTLHAPATPLLARYTRLALQRASALHADCHRDVRLAHAWGFSNSKPAIVLPGGGGVQADIFYPPGDEEKPVAVPRTSFTVINPRGIRAYVRSDTFFKAVPLVLRRYPTTRFVCPTMAGSSQAERWLDKLKIAENVALLPQQTRPQMAELFRRSQVAVSPSTHDGTPNTLLEAMACGCFPVVGDIESLREWIVPGTNGLLVDPADPQALADAILLALEQPDLRARAEAYNARLIRERADYGWVMGEAESFYRTLAGKSG